MASDFILKNGRVYDPKNKIDGEVMDISVSEGKIVDKVNGKAKVIAKLSNGTAVAAKESRWLATSFHPELTDDHRFHVYFLNMVKDSISS